jgi:hypothetical protein
MKIMKGKFERVPAVFSDDLQEVVESCLQKDPRFRPDSADLVGLAIMQPHLVHAMTMGG